MGLYFLAGSLFTLVTVGLGTWFGFFIASKRVFYDMDKFEDKEKTKRKPDESHVGGPIRPPSPHKVRMEKEGNFDEALKKAIF